MLQRGLAPSPLIATHLAMLWHHIRHVIAWMSRPKCDKAHFLHSLSGRLKGEIRTFAREFEGREWGAARGGKREKILWVETPKDKSLSGRLVLGFQEEEEGYSERRNGFHLSSSPIFLLFFIFYGCISPLHKIIPFSRVLM